MNFVKHLLLSFAFCIIFIGNSFATDFYWVGKDGNWNDAAHWSSTSGGAGGAGVPTKNDNVFFDAYAANSTVSILTNISLQNLSISELSNFIIKSSEDIQIDLYGSLTVPQIFNNQIKGSIHFKSAVNNNLNFGWGIWKSDMYFEGSGIYTFTSPLQIHNNSITLIKGSIDLKANDILCASFISNSSQKRKLISKGSTILAYKFWETNKTKFNYNFSQTKIIILSPQVNAVKIVGDNYVVQQSGNEADPETINAASIVNDTVSCGNACDGTLTVNFTTTCANGFVSWLPGVGDNYTGECGACLIAGPNGSSTITDLCPGIYTAVITDDCSGDIQAVNAEVEGHPSIVPLAQNTISPQCNGDCDGSANVIVTGAPYAEFTYLWLGQGVNDTLQSLSNLCDGSYNLQVDDGFGCVDTFNLIVNEPDSLFANVTVTDPLCFGECSGTATSNPVGGTSPFSFSWAPATGNLAIDTAQTFGNLCDGIAYTVSVTDDNGCINDTTFTPSEPLQMQIDTTVQHISCGGAADGSITANVLSGGAAPYNHHWSNGQVDNNTASSTINALIAGNYSDTITDANGCDTIISFTIIEPQILLTVTTPTNVSCFGVCNGSATTVASGGSGSYQYAWDSIPNAGGFNTFDSITNLCPGTYFVIVTDQLLCTVSDTIVITEPIPLLANTSATNITCSGANNGTATVNPSGGTGNPAIDFTYNWNGPSCSPCVTQSISSLSAGTYVVTVTDSVGCTITDSVTIINPQPLILSMFSTNELCAGNCDGTAAVSTTGGTGNPDVDFTYSWLPGNPVGQGTDSIFNLCPNVYTVTVTDSLGCSTNNSVTINPSTPIEANLDTTNTSCNGACNGTATVSPTGSGPFTVSWNGGSIINIPIGGSNTINTLCAGNHTLVITDVNSCSINLNFTISEPNPIITSTNTIDISCFGLSDGSAVTNASGGNGVLTYNWSTIPNPPVFNGGGQGTDSVFNLSAGIYYVEITDDSLCSINDTIEIFEPNQIFPNATFTNISCNGLADGSANTIPTGGAPPYVSYSWVGPSFNANTPQIGPLAVGQYILTVTDDRNCIARDTINIINPPALIVNANATNANCGDICNGSAIALPSGGTPGTTGYNYLWNNLPTNQTTPTANNLCVGEYLVTVTDSMGCTAQDTTIIAPLIQITINPTIIGISCNGACDGSATVFPTGGTQPYTYLWDSPLNPNNDSIITGLCSGFAVVTVTDDLGCTATDSINMPLDPSVLQTNGMVNQQTSCSNLCDAEVSHNPFGGTPPYTSVWSPIGIDTNNVCPTFATITVTDNNGCIASDTLIISEPNPIISNSVVTDVNCFGDSTGSISFNPTGGAGGTYFYTWISGPIIGSGASTNNLPAGIYTIEIQDSNGCLIVVTDTINEAPILNANPITNNIGCNDDCNGLMTVIVNGGTAPYTYQWANNQPISAPFDTIANICATPITNLTNTVTITDFNGCINIQNITITNPPALNANVSGTGVNCNGDCNGTAVVNPTGGTSPYTVLWSPYPVPADSFQITGLCTGNYLATVTDINGCVDTSTYTVSAPFALSVSLDSSNVSCNGNNNGSITANITGGTAPFSYSWAGPCAPIADTNMIDNLCAGVYTVTITDANNCSFQNTITISEPQPITNTPVVNHANCGANDGSITMSLSGGTPPYLHSWSTGSTSFIISNLTAGFYTDTVTDFNGCVEIFTIGISNPSGPSGVTSTVNDASCFGSCDGSVNVIVIGGSPQFNYNWAGPNGFVGTNDSTQNNLCAGTYNLTVTDASNCILATNILVGQADSISENATFSNTTCNALCDGIASVTPTGGTPPYTYVWSNNGSTNSSASGLCAGAVSVTITDFLGCQKTVSFTINSPNTLSTTTTQINPTCNTDCDGSATVNPIGGTGPYLFQWNDPLAQTGQTANNLCAGTYIVTVTDLNGCSVNDTVVVVAPSLIIDNAITTNSSCGNSDGTASVCGSTGGTGNHTYLWLNVPGNPTTCSVNGLSAGTYTVQITDNNLCSQEFLITISDANGPSVTINPTNASCNGVCDGQASAIASGVNNLSFLWQTGGQTTPTITGLCAGNYAVEVTDGNGCTTSQSVTISDNLAITATVSTTATTCNGACNGSALVTPNGGVPPYSFNWTGGNAAGQTINAVGGLCAGNYTVTITDFIGCAITENVVITEPNALTASVVGLAANCNGSCDGQATATPNGGTAPYLFSWSNGATTPTATALCEGVYTVVITDINGCTTTENVNIGDGIPITATINSIDVTPSNATCSVCDGSITVSNIAGGSGGPYSLLWTATGATSSSINNLCPGAYNLTITDNAGCSQEFNVLINNQNGQATLLTQAIDVTCFGSCDGVAFTSPVGGIAPVSLYQWNDPNLTTNDTATALCAGFYTVIMQDALGCITVDSVTVSEPLEILSNLTFTPPTCPNACDGTATVNPTGGVGLITVQWGASANNQTTETATGLCAGTHIVTLTDSQGCTKIDSVTLIEPDPIDITISSVSPTCFGDCDGTAIANASGGNPGYQYSWNTNPVQNNSLIGGLCASAPNFVVVTVTDNGNCVAQDSVQIINPAILTTTTVIDSSESCNNSCDGGITTTPSGGQAPYTFLWSNNATSQSITNLCAGQYFVTVIDANNCTVRDTVNLVAPTNLDVVIDTTNPNCGICNGAITSSPTGVGPYNFTWSNIANPLPVIQTDLNAVTSTINGLCAGTYNLEVTDLGTNCTSTHTVILNSANGATLNITSTDESCPNRCDGTATVTATGGTEPYSYSWSPVLPADTNQTASNLCAGFYTVTVVDSNNCISSDTVTINSTGLSLSISSIVPETCFGNCDGSATVVVNNGTPNYDYLWSPTSQTTAQAIGLCADNYVVTVTDNTNCTDSISTQITGPDMLTVIASVNSAISCNGESDGSAIANVLGGNPNYNYSWNTIPVQTSQIATNLSAGTYIVDVTDDNDCVVSDTITLTSPSLILDNPTLVFPACGVCDGSIQVNPSGGSGNYSYLWTTPNSPPSIPQLNTATIINLCAGAYTLTITDNTTGCDTTFNYALSNTNAPDPNLAITNASCNGVCDGTIVSNPIGNAPPYSFLWNTGNTGATISNLCAGQYSLTVTDTNGCVGVANNGLTQPDMLLANLAATNINCNNNCDGTVTAFATGGSANYTYNWTSVPAGTYPTDSALTGLCAGTYIVTIADVNTCSITDSITVSEPSEITVTSIQTDAACSESCDGSSTVTPTGGTGSYTYQWNGNTTVGQTNTLTNLCYGINYVQIFDQNNCSIIDTINIGAIDTIIANAGLDTNYCLGSTVNLNGVSGGPFTNVEWFELPSMNSLGTTNNITTTPTSTGVFGYVFQVTGACVVTDTVFITIDALPIIDAGEDVEIFEDEEAILAATGGSTYSWSPGETLNDSTVSSPIASPSITTTYYVTGTSSGGCVAIDSVTVIVLPQIKFPDGISPNGDGANDVWIIDFIEQYPDNVVEIYNRWGELLFHADGYEQNWDGTYNGKELPIGTYYYIIDLKDESIEPFTGPITILR